MISKRLSVVILLSGLLACRAVAAQPTPPPSKTSDLPVHEAGINAFETRIRPILAEHC